MKIWKSLFFLLFSAFNSFSFAETTWTKNSIKVTPDSEMQRQIDSVMIEIFNSPIQNNLCGIYNNAESWYLSVAISPHLANEFAKRCASKPMEPAKPLPKKYYISFEKNMGLDSWTDYGNNTYIYINEGLTRQRLKSILIHEIAISTDAKARLLYPSYITYRYLLSDKSKNRRARSFDVSARTEYEKTLQQAFNFASWGPLARAFSTIRAYQFELKSQGKNQQILPQDQCAAAVRELLPIMKSLPTPPKETGGDADSLLIGLVEVLTQANDTTVAPYTDANETAMLQFLLSPQLTLKDLDNSTVTFCQFMAKTLVTNTSKFSTMGAGPRPRLTGGSGGQGRGNEESYLSTVLADFEQDKNKRPSEQLQDQELNSVIEKMKQDNKSKLLTDEAVELPPETSSLLNGGK